jgi:hypothetical protein
MILRSLVAGLVRSVDPRRLALGLAMVCLLAAAAQGQYVVKYTAHAPAGPTDPIWNTANPIGPYYWIDGSSENAMSADMAMDARYLWDGTSLYGRILVTDNLHANNTADGPPYTNQWNMDDIEFYINATNTNATSQVAGTTEDDWGINNLGHFNLSTTNNGATATYNNLQWWTDSNFDATGLVNTVNGGNYGVQQQWPWQGPAGAGGLGLPAAPTAGYLLRLGAAADDADVAGTRKNHPCSVNYAGNGALVYSNPSTYGAAVLGAPWPVLQSVNVVDLTHVDVTFTVALDPASAQNAANYLTTGPTVSAAALQAGNTTVRLTTSLMTKGATYRLSVSNVQDSTLAYTIQPNPGIGTISVPPPTPPTVVSTTVVDATHVTVAYSMAMDPATVATATNYSVSGGLTVASVSSANSSSATLTVSPMAMGLSYTMTINNVQNTLGDAIAANTTQTFVYKVMLVQYPFGTAAGSSTTTAAGLSAVETFTVNAAAQFDTWSETRDSGLTNALSWGANSTGSAGSFAGNRYVEFGITVAPGYTANLSSLNFLAACNWGNDPKGIFVECSLSGYSAGTSSMIFPATLLNSWQGGGRQAAPYYNTCAVDLSGPAFQSIPAGTVVTFRIYGFSNNSENWALLLDNVTLWGGTMSTYGPPTVAITSPTSTYSAASGSTVTFMASASTTNPGGSIAALQFFDGATLLGSGAAAGGGVYTYAWHTSGATLGLHAVTARATDNLGLSTVSSPATIINLAAPPGPPTIAITAPTGTCIAGLGNPITLVATASTSNAGGSILDVRFYDGATPLGSGSLQAGTWTYSWTSTSATLGTHSVTAVAVDNTAVTATSAPITVQFLIPGDGNNDGVVDGKDYGVWQNGYGRSDGFMTGDYNGDGIVDGKDYGVWQNNYGHTSASGDVVAAASLEDATAQAPMAAAAPAQATSAPRLIAVTPASGAVASGVTVITLVFDSDVQIGAGAVEVSGLATGPHGDYTATYDAATRTLALTFAATLPADRYTVRVIGSFVVAADGGAALDGAASGMPGSNATAEFAAE